MLITKDNNPQNIFDQHFDIDCLHCTTHSNISAISIPRYEYLIRFRPDKISIGYRCDACNNPIILIFRIDKYDPGDHKIIIDEEYEEIQKAIDNFELKYLPEQVNEDFHEALVCYSVSCYNAFASMCRRCIQSSFTTLGAKGKDKVINQLKDIQDTAEIDDDTFELLKQIIISGHDGAHPHLPKMDYERAKLLLEFMKDILYQLFIRKAKIQEAVKLRQSTNKNRENDT